MATHRRDAAVVTDENGAVVQRRRRDGIDPACSDAEH
jgi:hypothetical protein